MLHGPARNDKPNHWVSWAVVYKKWKLSCNKDMSYHELYDAINDPLEKNDLASKNAQTVKEMKTLLMDWQKLFPINLLVTSSLNYGKNRLFTL